MNYKELSKVIGKKVVAKLTVDGQNSFILLTCEITDVTVTHGHFKYELNFEGQSFWVTGDKIKFI